MSNPDTVSGYISVIELAVKPPRAPEWIGAVRAWMALYRETEGTALDRNVRLLGEALKRQDAVAVRSHLYALRGGRLKASQFQEIHNRA